jgi:hypothetical protein
MQKISTLLRDQFQFSLAVSSLIQYINSRGCSCSLKECLRTQDQQDIYFKRGKTKVRESQHQKCLAVDICIFRDGEWLTKFEDLKIFGVYWQNLGLAFRWGGDWDRSGKQSSFFDCIHFEFNDNWGD